MRLPCNGDIQGCSPLPKWSKNGTSDLVLAPETRCAQRLLGVRHPPRLYGSLSGSSVRILGKGRKVRRCPLWQKTALELEQLIKNRSPEQRVFLNRRREPLTRFGIHTLIRTCVVRAGKRMPSLLTKSISPHTLRHSPATHLLRAGVDLNTIRAWLGQVSFDTTQIYAEIDLETKARALDKCQTPDSE
jgi:integrase/recombinase XerD